jgi:glutaredoxin
MNGRKDWVDVVDGALNRADRFIDRFRKTPRRRLDSVPDPLVPVDPFGPPKLSNAAPPAAEKPLGDPGLPVQIFGKRTCDETARTVMFLRERSIVARMIDLEDPDNLVLERRLVRETKRYQTPWIFVRGKYVGGLEEVAARAKSGELDALLS